MRVLKERGGVLVQVLVAIVFISLLSAAILHARLQPALTIAGNTARVKEGLAARAALNRLTESWARLGSCADDAGIDCSGSGCACRCVMGDIVVTASRQDGVCALRIVPTPQN